MASFSSNPINRRGKYSGFLGKRKACQEMGGKPCKGTLAKLLEVLFLKSPTTEKEVQCLVGLFGILRKCLPHLEIMFYPIY